MREGPQDATAPSGFRDLSPPPGLSPTHVLRNGWQAAGVGGYEAGKLVGGAMGGSTDQSGAGLTWVPNLTGSPVLLTGQLFPGAGGGMLCALETVTPLPWERGVAVCPQGWGPQGWGAAPPSTQGGRPGTGGYSPARLRPES